MDRPNNIESLRKKRSEWLEWMSARDGQTINKQLSRMIEDAAVYKIINRSRRFIPRTEAGDARSNGMVHAFIDRTFVSSQIMSIRRLLDPEKSTGVKSVYSMVRLLKDMAEHRELLTRADMIAVEDLPYDYDQFKREAWNEYIRATEGHGDVGSGQMRADGKKSEMRHKTIDRLCGVQAHERSKTDTVSASLLEGLIGKLEGVGKKVKIYANKFIAHAATPSSRESEGADTLGLTFQCLDDACEEICKAWVVVNTILDGPKRQFLPMPPLGFLKYIDEPLVAPEAVAKMSEAWDEYKDLTENWYTWDWSSLVDDTRQGVSRQ